MSLHTRSQCLAQAAFSRIHGHGKPAKEYVSFAKKFPELIHTCGLAQAVAFALAKGNSKKEQGNQKPEFQYLEDLAAVLKAGGHEAILSAAQLGEASRSESLNSYLRLSRDAIHAASWLKRYAEALGEDNR